MLDGDLYLSALSGEGRVRRIALWLALVLIGGDLLAQGGRIPPFLRRPTVADENPIAEARRVDWTQAGAGAAMETGRSSVCDTIAAYSGTAATINTAITNCATDGVVLLEAGTFTLSTGIQIHRSDVTLRGDGPDSTIVKFTGGCSGLGGSVSGSVCLRYPAGGDPIDAPDFTRTWSAGYDKGDTVITLNSVTSLATNRLLMCDQLDDSDTDNGGVWQCKNADVCSQEGNPGGRTGRTQLQMAVVSAINGTDVTLNVPLGMPNWRTGQTPQCVYETNSSSGIGVEDLTFDFSGNTGSTGGILVAGVFQSWIQNIRTINGNRNHIWFYYAGFNTVRDSYFYGVQSGGSQSYGIEQYQSSYNLVENNITEHITSANIGGNQHATVIAYNYSIDDYFATATWMQASSQSHSAGANFNLYEGNIGPGFNADNTHGTSHFHTAFRNYWIGWETGKDSQTVPVHVYAPNRYFNFLGNVLGRDTTHTAYECAPASSSTASCANADAAVFQIGWSDDGGAKHASMPNDTLVKSTMFRWGNYDNVNDAARFESSEVPSGLSDYPNAVPSSQTLPNSLLYSSEPSWFGSVAWPPIGPDVSGSQGPGSKAHKIPAQVCYEAMADDPAYSGTTVRLFNADDCYPTP